MIGIFGMIGASKLGIPLSVAERSGSWWLGWSADGHQSAAIVASAMSFFSTGDQVVVVARPT